MGQLDPGNYAEAIGFQIDGEGYDQSIVRATANEERKLDNSALVLEPPLCNPPG